MYGDMEIAILGMTSEGSSVKRVETFSAQEDIEFGHPVFGYIGEKVKCFNYHNDVAKLVFDADLVTNNVVDITISGIEFDSITFATDHETTMGLIIAEAKAKGFESILDPADTDKRTIFFRKVGSTLVVDSAAVTLGAGQAGITDTVQSSQVFLGISMRTQKVLKDGGYKDKDAVNVMSIGKIYASIKDEDAEANTIAYLDTTDGIFSISGTDIDCKFRSNKITNSDTENDMALVEVNGQKKVVSTVYDWS